MIRRLFLEGDSVSLTRLLPEDAEWLETWVTDPITTRFMATGRTQATRETLAAQIAAWKEPTDWPFAIVPHTDLLHPIGTVGLYSVDWLSRKAEFRVLIGAPYHGKGYGTAATKAMVAYGFGRLNLHRIWLGVTSSNTRAVKAYLRAGFRDEGMLEDDLYRDGIYYHSLRMAILRSGYKEMRAWDTEKWKPAETSAPGPATARPAAAPSIDSSRPAGA